MLGLHEHRAQTRHGTLRDHLPLGPAGLQHGPGYLHEGEVQPASSGLFEEAPPRRAGFLLADAKERPGHDVEFGPNKRNEPRMTIQPVVERQRGFAAALQASCELAARLQRHQPLRCP